MAVVVAVIGTAHLDHEDAVRSVSGRLKAAGYDVLDYRVSETNEPSLQSPLTCGLLEACEPEVNPRGCGGNGS